MGYDVGCSGMFGVLLSDYQEALGALYEEFIEAGGGAHEADEDDDTDELPDERAERLCTAYTDRFIDAFRARGIAIPDGAYLGDTGTDEDRPGRTSTPAGDWVLGFGLFTKPWDFPAMEPSFRQAADWHTWVWGG